MRKAGERDKAVITNHVSSCLRKGLPQKPCICICAGVSVPLFKRKSTQKYTSYKLFAQESRNSLEVRTNRPYLTGYLYYSRVLESK